MNAEDVPPVKCPLCSHVPCEVLGIGSDPEIVLPATTHLPRPKIHATCPACGVEFYLTTAGT